MGRNKSGRTDGQKTDDYIFIAKLLAEGRSYRDIAAQLNEHNKEIGKDYTLSKSTIGNDVKKILEEWRNERLEIIDQMIDVDLLELRHIKRECWESWEKSKTKESHKYKYKRKPGGGVSEKILEESTVEKTAGDPRYIEKILTCMEKRQTLLGYAAPKRVEHSGKIDSNVTSTAAVGLVQMNNEEMEKEAQRLLNSMLKSSTTNAGRKENNE